MTTVASRQITVSSHRMATTPSPPATQAQPPSIRDANDMATSQGIKSYILHHNRRDDPNTKAIMRAATRTKVGNIGDSYSPPPPPPPTRTSSVATQITTNQLKKLDSQYLAATSASDSERFSESLNMNSSGSVVPPSGTGNSGETSYGRQRSNTGDASSMQPQYTAAGRVVEVDDSKKFNTIQGRSHSRLNPNAHTPNPASSSTSTAASTATASGGHATLGRGMHGRFSTSQPHLNRIDQQGTSFVKPNDRIKKSMFDADSEDEKDGKWGQDYGSGYEVSLMKMSHGEIQKHAVAVTTPVAPPVAPRTVSARRKAGSDPNILESVSRSSVSPADEQEKRESPTTRERSNSLISSTNSSNEASAIPTSAIARAYREHLIEKMDKERQGMRGSPSNSSVSSVESPVTLTHPQTPPADSLSSKMRSITPSQLQALDIPDRACLPRILPPPSSSDAGKQEKLSASLENGGYPINPFLAHSSSPMVTNPDLTMSSQTGFVYGTLPRNLPRKRTSLQEHLQYQQQQMQSGHLTGTGRTQSVTDINAPPPPHKGRDFPDHALTSVEEMSAYFQSRRQQNTGYANSQEAPAAVGGWEPRHAYHGADSSQSTTGSAMSSQSSGNVPYSPGYQTDRRNFGAGMTHNQTVPSAPANQSVAQTTPTAPPTSTGRSSIKKQAPVAKRNLNVKPPVLPKPTNRKNGRVTSGNGSYERASSDTSLNYGQVSNPQLPSSPMPLTPYPTTVATFDTDSMQLHQPPYTQSVQYGRPQKHRFNSANLLEIQEADELEERELKRMSSSEMKLFDYATLNSSQFPKRVRITKGFCSDSTEVTLSQGEEFDLHYLQEMKSVMVVDPYGVRYAVPLNSSAKFSIVYDPFGVEKVAVQGFHFKTAGVIMDLKIPPIVVAASQECDGGTAESSVGDGEILVVEGVKNVFHGRLLKVYSLNCNTVKYLDEQCSGEFTTNPKMIQMSLSQVYKCSISLPQKVIVTPESAIPLPTALRSNLAVMKQFMIVKSVVATTLAETDSTSLETTDTVFQAVGLSLDLDVEVMEVAIEEKQLERLLEKTNRLLKNLDRVTVVPYIDMPSSTSYSTQCDLLSNLDPKEETDSAEITAPSYASSSRKKFQVPSQKASAGSSSSEFVDAVTQSRLKAMEMKYEKLEARVNEMSDNMKQVVSKVDQIHTYLRKAQDAMTKHKQKLQEDEEERKKSTNSSSSSLSRNLLSSTSSQDHLHHRGVSRSHSDGIARKKPPSSGPSSKASTLSRNSSRFMSESESVDGDAKYASDEVFTRPASTGGNKPPVMPKPKSLKKGTNGKLMQKLKSIKVSGKSGKQPTKREAKGASVSELEVANVEPSLHDEYLEMSSEPIDLREFLIETAPPSLKPKLKPKPILKESKPTANDASSASPTSISHTPTGQTSVSYISNTGQTSTSPTSTSTSHTLASSPITSHTASPTSSFASHTLTGQTSASHTLTGHTATTPASTSTGSTHDITSHTTTGQTSVSHASTTTGPTPTSHTSSSPAPVDHTSSSPTPVSHIHFTPGVTKVNTDAETAAAEVDELTDWCLQVEDELTQLYNDLSAS